MRMHAHQAIVHVVNRSTRPVEVMWDGMPTVIPPGYKRVPKVDDKGQPVLLKDGTPVEEIVGAGPEGKPFLFPMLYYAAEAARRQNPVMGTLDPHHHLRYETLVGVPEWNNDCSHIEQSNADELLDRSLLPPDRQNVQHLAVPGSRRDLSGRKHRRSIVGAGNHTNPTGLEMSYEGGAAYDR